MEKLLVMTDLHICARGLYIVGLDPAARLKAALAACLQAHPDAAGLILMGDLTHNGLPEEYDVLCDILADLPLPIVPMIGNHDRRAAFLAAFPDAPQTPTGHIQKVWDLGEHRIITLDSLDGPPYPDGHHAGRLCPDRMEFLQDALATKGDRGALICMHHPPFATGIVGMDNIMLADGDRFLDILRPYMDVHLLCGHIHRTISGNTRGVPWSMLKGTCHQGVLDLASQNAHLSTNEPGSYGVVLLMPDGIVVHSEDVDVPGAAIFDGYD
ncbi:MAG: metallophosphoesterase [Pseudomonadota bacterium]